MPDQLVQFKATLPARVTLILVMLLALFVSWFVMRWYVGSAIAEYFNPEENRLQTARLAAALAPDDPFAHLRVASVALTDLPPDQISLAVAEFEKAASLSPNDYRFWAALGHALEQAGEFDRAEKALREAIRLAPSYAYPRWLLGNLLVREDKISEGFAELRTASEADPQLQPQLFNLAWQVNKNDPEALKTAVGGAAETRAAFSKYLLERGRFDDSQRLWDTLSESEKKENRLAADGIIASLVTAKRYHQAVDVWNQIAPSPAYNAQLGHIIDPGFEDNNIAHGPGAVFGWQVQSSPQAQIGIDAGQGHTGQRSLRVVFQVRSHIDAINVSQLVPVQANTQYSFECYVKTSSLESAATPVVLIVNAADESAVATSEAAASGTTDWQRISLAFKTGPKSEAIKIKIMRNSCADNAVCPIFGTIWYDDFDLKSGK